MSLHDFNVEVKAAAAKAGTGVALGTTTAITLNQWVAIITIVYFLLQIGLLAVKYKKLWDERKKK